MNTNCVECTDCPPVPKDSFPQQSDAVAQLAKLLGTTSCTTTLSNDFASSVDSQAEIGLTGAKGSVNGTVTNNSLMKRSGCESLTIMSQEIMAANTAISCAFSLSKTKTSTSQSIAQTIKIITHQRVDTINLSQSATISFDSSSSAISATKVSVNSALNTMLTAIGEQSQKSTTGWGALQESMKSGQSLQEMTKNIMSDTAVMKTINDTVNQQFVNQTIEIHAYGPVGTITSIQNLNIVLATTSLTSTVLEALFKKSVVQEALGEFKQKNEAKASGLDDVIKAIGDIYGNIVMGIVLLVAVCLGFFMFFGKSISATVLKNIKGVSIVIILVGIGMLVIGCISNSTILIILSILCILGGIVGLWYIIRKQKLIVTPTLPSPPPSLIKKGSI